MLTTDAVAHFGSRYAIAKLLKIEPPSVYRWGDRPPPLRQLQLEMLSGGALLAESKYKLLAVPAPA